MATDRAPKAATESPILGFGVSGYRTLHDVEIISPGPLSVICGPNNTGKSSLLEALSLYPSFLANASGQAKAPRNPVQEDLEVRIALDTYSDEFATIFEGPKTPKMPTQEFLDALSELLGRYWWVILRNQSNNALGVDQHATHLVELQDKYREWSTSNRRVWAKALNTASSTSNRAPPGVDVTLVHNAVKACLTSPTIKLIQDVRRKADKPLEDQDLAKLARANSRKTDRSRLEGWAQDLEYILQDVFGADVRYEVWPDGESGDFRLSLDGEEDVPLNGVGAGVREVVAIGFQALAEEGATVLAIEEPENCLHPAAVRRLVRSLPARAGVQLFVSTHSSAVVNADPDSVVHLTRSGMTTKSQQVDGPREQYEAVRALGYSPAELVLTPCAIWVEGPSDRLYIVEWLGSHGLREGIDYQVMFFGGALAAHVAVSPDTIPEQSLAAIRNLSRYCAVVVDSDKNRKRGRSKKHVQRFKEELEGDAHSLLIVTPGREVENYLPPQIANKLRTGHGADPITDEDFPYARIVDSDVASRISKVSFAKQALAELGGQVPERARKQVGALAEFIRSATPR